MAEISATIPYLMNFDLEGMLKSKKAFREQLAARPIAEKLRLLDAMRERALAIRSAAADKPALVQEVPASYGERKGKEQ